MRFVLVVSVGVGVWFCCWCWCLVLVGVVRFGGLEGRRNEQERRDEKTGGRSTFRVGSTSR